MSEPLNEQPIPVLDPSLDLDATFAAIMGAVAPETAPEAPGEGGAPAQTAPADGGRAASGDQAAGTQAVAAADGAPGAGDEPPVQDAGTAAPAPAQDGAGYTPGSVEYSTIRDQFGVISNKIEEGSRQVHINTAREETETEYKQYFDALRKHPRMLVGQQVPAIGKEGREVLRDSNDAKDWQDAVKQLLVDEINDRATRLAEGDREMLSVLHSSIELFQNNEDLVPGTKQFDADLANRFARLAQPYELRLEGKLNGYTIPVQPLINQIRTQLAAERASKPAAPAAPSMPEKKTTTQENHQPQKGIPSRAGASTEEEDFSVLFGTIGLPNLRI